MVKERREQRAGRAQLGLFGAVAVVLGLAIERPVSSAARPTDEAHELARVPARRDVAQSELERLAAAARDKPGDRGRSVALARAYLEAVRRDGDPRYLGMAEAVLAVFPVEATADVRVLRATILQSRHEFDAAWRELDRALIDAPDDAQALLTRATIATVRADYEAARADCARLDGLASVAIVAACRAPIDARSGRGAEAQMLLVRALAGTRDRGERALLHSLAGEQAYWAGDAADAERHLKAASGLDPADRYTRAVYADLLLDQGRAGEVAALASDFPEDDALALRLALALQAQGALERAGALARVRGGFEASRLRGDTVHRREEARLALALGDAPSALTCALESWAVQREPWDARVVLEAALAAERPHAAAAVVRWLETTRFAAPRLRELAEQIRARAERGKR